MNRESKRLVYAEGISLQNALRLSKEYTNIIFLTDDNHTCDNLDANYGDSIGSYESYSTQPLGINIVRNGIKYVPIAGIHPTLNSFMLDGKKYELKIQKDTGLLCVVPYEIERRIIYIGKYYDEIVNLLNNDMPIDNYIEQYNSNQNNISPVTIYESGNEYVKMYFPIINNTYSYLIIYTGINVLSSANIGHLDLLNMNITDRNENIVIYHTDETGQIVLNEAAVQNLIQNSAPENSLFYNNEDDKVYVIISSDHMNNITITNTLGQGNGGINNNEMTNGDLPISFEIKKIHIGNRTIESVLYNVYELGAENISGVSLKIKNI